MAQNRLACLLLGLAFGSAPAVAESITGKVVAVHDGDTLTVLVDRRQVKVRLSEVDAPELKQAYGQRSRQSLVGMCFGMTAMVQEAGTDRYKRTVGRVTCAGTDANTEQVRRGMAWVFDKYVSNPELYGVQDEAKASRRGLWAESSPAPPWEWRAATARK